MAKGVDATSPTERRPYCKHACDPCRTRKLKCSGHQPCFQCTGRGFPHECLFLRGDKRTKAFKFTRDTYNRLVATIARLRTRLRGLGQEDSVPSSPIGRDGDAVEPSGAAISDAAPSPIEIPTMHRRVVSEGAVPSGPGLFLEIPPRHDRAHPALHSPYSSFGLSSATSSSSFTESTSGSEHSHGTGRWIHQQLPSDIIYPGDGASHISHPQSHASSLSGDGSHSEFADRNVSHPPTPSIGSVSPASSYSFAPHSPDPLQPRVFERCPYLPPHLDGLTRHDHDNLLKMYFDRVAPWYSRVVPELFERDFKTYAYGDGLARVEPFLFSPSLHCACLAEATKFADQNSLWGSEPVRTSLFDTARTLAEEEIARGDLIIPAIVTLVILAQHHYEAENGHIRAYCLIGLATSASIVSALHLHPRPTIDTLEDLRRAWCSWCIFSLDVLIALQMGHQRRIPRPAQSFEEVLQQLSTLVSPKNDLFATSCANYNELMLLCAPPDLSSGAAVVAVDHGAISAWYISIGIPRRAPPVEVSGSSTYTLLLHILADYCTILSHRYVSTIAPYEVLHKFGEPLLNFVSIIIQRGEVPMCPAMLAHCVHAVGELASRQAGPSSHGSARDYAFKLLQQAHSHLLSMRWRCALAHASQLQLKLTELSPQPILDPTLARAYDERNATRPVIPRLVIEDATATDTSVHNVVANNHSYTLAFY